MTAEREDAISKFFEEQRSLERTAGDAAALAIEKLQYLEEELRIASAFADDSGLGARADREALIYEAAVSLGRACVDGLSGLTASGAVNEPILRTAAVQVFAPPLDDEWQTADNPFVALTEIADSQKKKIEGLREKPNQLYRFLFDAVALAADVATWTTWTQLGSDQETGSKPPGPA